MAPRFPSTPRPLDPAAIAACVDVLVHAEPEELDEASRELLERAVARFYKRVRKTRRKADARVHAPRDRAVIDRTATVQRWRGPSDEGSATGPERLRNRRPRCYVCSAYYRDVDPHYHALCPACAALHHEKRRQSADLSGRTAVVTGGRVKIGFQTALRLLRSGARVLATTRFPHDALERYRREVDFESFAERLRIVPLELGDLRAVLALVDLVGADLGSLDILVNNAAVSAPPPPEVSAMLHAREVAALDAGDPGWIERRLPSPSPAGPISEGSNAGRMVELVLDPYGVPLDPRPRTPWSHTLEEVTIGELLEASLVNHVAPCLLVARLRPLMRRSPFASRFVVNVSGTDGRFVEKATAKHPHVNMTKAALNMLTRTASADLAADGIYMNSVDTGWISAPGLTAERFEAQDHPVPPLDDVDGASAIFDPIALGARGQLEHGQMLRHFRPVSF